MDRLHVARVFLIAFAPALATVDACVAAPGNLTGGGGHGGGSVAGAGRAGGSAAGDSGVVITAGVSGTDCDNARATETAIPPDVLILLEASGSMNEDMTSMVCDGGCGARSKWAQVTSAIDTVVAETDASVNWGLMLFGNFGADGCTVAAGPTEPVAPNNAGAFAAAIAGRTSPNGGTSSSGSAPTRLAVYGASGYLGTRIDPNPKLIVLATDGAPACLPGSGDPTSDDSNAAVDAIANAASQGYPTYVVGIATGSGPADAVLDRMAIAGGVPRTGSPAYYPVSGTDDMVGVLNRVVAAVAYCTFAIPPLPTSGAGQSGDHVGVLLDGSEIPHDTSHMNGWDYGPGLTQVQLYGPVCDTVRGQPTAHAVTVYHHCLLP